MALALVETETESVARSVYFYLITFQNIQINKAVYLLAGSDKGLLRIVNSISNAVGFFYPRNEHLVFPAKKPFLVDISESLHPLDNFRSETVNVIQILL